MEYLTLPMTSSQHYVFRPNPLGGPVRINPWTYRMKVDGEGTVKVQPDMADVVLGVITENKQLELAQRENALKMNAVLNALRELGIPKEDIQTLSYVIEPQYDYVEGRQVFRGYRVLHSLRIIVRDMNNIGRIVDKAVESGANQVSSIRFFLSDPSKYYQRALEAAIDDAITKSKTIGRKLDIVVSGIPIQIVEERYEEITPISPVLMQATGTATPIQAGQIEIKARIEAVFTYTPRPGRQADGFSM